MAKQNSIDIDKYILVTDANRKFCIRMGRKCYVMSYFNKAWKEDGQFMIRPRLKEGWFYFGSHKCFVTKEELRSEYTESFKEVIDHFIKEKKLYIIPSEHLIKFEKP